MQQPVVPVLPERPRRRLPSATFLVALAALAVSLVSLGVTVGASHSGGSKDTTCGGSEYRVIGAAQLPVPWHLVSQSYLGPASFATVMQGTAGAAATPGPNPIPQLSVSVTCFGSGAADVMREYHTVPPVDASPIPAPTLGDDALAFEVHVETFGSQYFIFVRRGNLVASIAGMVQVTEAQVQAVAAAIDRAMRETD